MKDNVFTKSAFGDALNQIVFDARRSLLAQNEIAHFAYIAFEHAISSMPSNGKPVTFEYPIGWGSDDRAISHEKTYSQQEIIARYRHLESNVLPINVIGALVTIVEAMVHDLLRAVILRFPQKLGDKRQVKTALILSARSIEETHERMVDSVLNSISYESPRDLAERFNEFLGIELLKCSWFECYIEIKATRDVYVHNRGFANETYERKAGSHARARRGELLPINLPYVFKSNEFCLRLTEWFEPQLHQRWHSLALERRQANNVNPRAQTPSGDITSEELKRLASELAADATTRSVSADETR